MCVGHASQLKRGTPLRPLRKVRLTPNAQICDYPDCGRRHASGGLCSGHEAQMRRTGTLVPIVPKKKNPKGYGYLNDSGYYMITVPLSDSLNPNKTTHMLEHRYIMAKHLGRPLLSHENVHHINGIKDDNRIENLELWIKAQPSGVRVSDQIKFAIDTLSLYRSDLNEAQINILAELVESASIKF